MHKKIIKTKIFKICCNSLYLTKTRLYQIIRLLFSRPNNCSTVEGRSQERYRRAMLTTLVMVAARVSNILTGLITVPITLKYLGEDLFGIWMVLTSVVAFLSFSDFGIGVGLRNLLIECAGKDDLESPRKLIGNALLVLATLAVLLILLAFTVFPHLSWGELIKCKNPASVPQILPAVQAMVVMFAFGLPVTQLQNIANAYQRGYWGYLCFLVGRIFGFLFVLWCVWAKQPLWLLAGGYIGIPFFVTLIGWVIFLIAVPALRPWPVRPEWALMHSLFGIGIFVLIHNLSQALINASPILLIANTINAANAIPYSVTQRLLGVSSVITMSLMGGISVAVGEAWHRREYRWIQKTIRRSEIAVFFSGVVPLVIFIFAGRVIILWWTKSPVAVPSFFLLLACTLFACAISIGSVYSNCLIAMNYVRFIAVTRFAAGIVVLLGGYVTGVVSQSSTYIAFLQFFFGALIPNLLIWWKMKRVLLRSKDV